MSKLKIRRNMANVFPKSRQGLDIQNLMNHLIKVAFKGELQSKMIFKGVKEGVKLDIFTYSVF